ncbi:uncharacterized protein C8A04DRAFT_32045 [Dichotomopilus funicola]|uniref:Uncharacterized protein n=1 Tax=Dichotomopilus funicola TaxID=1934379 RepID=A0AAN6UYY1_9PEZI|nr:hypothetical protein C8A04DRAFT_32045 [Dichotomopilus funicola]
MCFTAIFTCPSCKCRSGLEETLRCQQTPCVGAVSIMMLMEGRHFGDGWRCTTPGCGYSQAARDRVRIWVERVLEAQQRGERGDEDGQNWSNVDNRLPAWYDQSDDGLSSMHASDHEATDDDLFMDDDDDHQAEDEEPGHQEAQANDGLNAVNNGNNNDNSQQQPPVAPLAAQVPDGVALGGHIPNWRATPNLPELSDEHAAHIDLLLARAEQEISAHEATQRLTQYWTPGEDDLLLFLRRCGFPHNQIAGYYRLKGLKKQRADNEKELVEINIALVAVGGGHNDAINWAA